MRPAFTIVELLVAIAVFSVGVLGLAATAGLVAAHVGDGARLTDAAHAARSVIDSLATRPCAMLVSGSSAAGGRTMEWDVQRDSMAASVGLTLGTPLRRRSQRQTYRVIVPCAAE